MKKIEFGAVSEELFQSYCNKIYIFLEYLILKRMFDIFLIVFQESTFNNSK